MLIFLPMLNICVEFFVLSATHDKENPFRTICAAV